jgi:hypothetical protein
MTVVLVLHEMRSKPRRTKMIDCLRKSYPISIQLTKSALAVHTRKLPAQIFEDVKACIRAQDKILILPLNKPYTGYAPRTSTTWLSDYLTSQP